jgi:hypothetical protein
MAIIGMLKEQLGRRILVKYPEGKMSSSFTAK